MNKGLFFNKITKSQNELRLDTFFFFKLAFNTSQTINWMLKQALTHSFESMTK